MREMNIEDLNKVIGKYGWNAIEYDSYVRIRSKHDSWMIRIGQFNAFKGANFDVYHVNNLKGRQVKKRGMMHLQGNFNNIYGLIKYINKHDNKIKDYGGGLKFKKYNRIMDLFETLK